MIIYFDDSYHRVFRPSIPSLLQSATTYFVAKCDSLLLQSATILLASLTVIIHIQEYLQNTIGKVNIRYFIKFKIVYNTKAFSLKIALKKKFDGYY